MFEHDFRLSSCGYSCHRCGADGGDSGPLGDYGATCPYPPDEDEQAGDTIFLACHTWRSSDGIGGGSLVLGAFRSRQAAEEYLRRNPNPDREVWGNDEKVEEVTLR